MRPRLLSLTFLFAGLILSSRSIYAVDLCMTPDFARAVDRTEVIFSGKITNIERVQNSTAAAGDYIVTFKVETWWKGTPSHESRVLWQSSVWDCPFVPVGEVGEEYLVYGDPSKNNTTGNQFPEVTIFNRTSKVPANLKTESILINELEQTNPNQPEADIESRRCLQ